MPGLASRTAAGAVRAYQRCISPLMGPSCRFSPTCSEYARLSIMQHGLLRALPMIAWRLLRCHPYAAGGDDPVPPAQGSAGPPGG